MPIADWEKLALLGRFPHCPYAGLCDNAIRAGCYPAYFCQCHHGRELNSPDFAHDYMQGYMTERFAKV